MIKRSPIVIKNKPCNCGCGRSGRIFSKGLLKECWVREYGKPIARQPLKIKPKDKVDKDESRANLIADLDAVFSLFLRIKSSDKNGIAQCVTCHTKDHYKNMDCGHWIPRANMGTRWNEYNTGVQCKKCNQFNYGEEKKFAEYIEKCYTGMCDWLAEISQQPTKFSISDLKELLITYREKLRIVKLKLK